MFKKIIDSKISIRIDVFGLDQKQENESLINTFSTEVIKGCDLCESYGETSYVFPKNTDILLQKGNFWILNVEDKFHWNVGTFQTGEILF